jgi:hypothetical protein
MGGPLLPTPLYHKSGFLNPFLTHLVERPSCLFKEGLTAALARHTAVDLLVNNPQVSADSCLALATVVSQYVSGFTGPCRLS